MLHLTCVNIQIVGTKSDPAHGSGRKFAQEVHQRDDEVISEEDDKRSVKKRKLPHHEHAQHDGPTVTKKQKEEGIYIILYTWLSDYGYGIYLMFSNFTSIYTLYTEVLVCQYVVNDDYHSYSGYEGL